MLHSITLSQKLRTILTDKESQSRRRGQEEGAFSFNPFQTAWKIQYLRWGLPTRKWMFLCS